MNEQSNIIDKFRKDVEIIIEMYYFKFIDSLYVFRLLTIIFTKM